MDARYLDLVTQKTATKVDAENGKAPGLCQIALINPGESLGGYSTLGPDCSGVGEVEYRINEIRADLDAILKRAKAYFEK